MPRGSRSAGCGSSRHVACPGRLDRLELRTFARVRAERPQARDDVEEVSRESRERAPAPLRRALGGLADQHHEDRDQREGDGEHDRRAGIAGQAPGDDRKRRHRRDHQLGKVAGEVGLDRVDSLDRSRRKLPPLLAREPTGTFAQQARDQPASQVPQDPDGPQPARSLEPHRNESTPDREHGEGDELRRYLPERLPVHEDSRDHVREQGRLRDQHRDGHDAQPDVGDQQRPRRPRRTDQPPLDLIHPCGPRSDPAVS